jgi:DNA mismatch repair protein MutS
MSQNKVFTSQDIHSIKDVLALSYLLESAFEELPTEDNFLKKGFDKELDEYTDLAFGGKELLAKMCEEEKQKTGVNSLKIKYNRVFGYFFEVPLSQSENLPEYFVRRQTLVNAERFITDELKSFESKILSAEQKKKAREQFLFQELQKVVLSNLTELQNVSRGIAEADLIQGFAALAQEKKLCRPKVTEYKTDLSIIDGRHLVVENALDKESKRFIPNSLEMKDDTFHLITGPNMGGKSTYLRQNALIVFLAHIGSFVPASEAIIPCSDQIFTRIGSGDSLSTGESTFLVEMQESSRILRNATEKSFVILDEVGRGTSTYDGLAIAWAITEYLEKKNVKTLFATHYHELISLVSNLKNARNFSVRVIEDAKKGIIFLHQVYEGGAEKSFGIAVAKSAGFPFEVIEKAEDVLHMLEKTEKNPLDRGGQISLFEEVASQQRAKETVKIVEKKSEVEELLKKIDPNQISPIDALKILFEVKEKVK